MMGSHSYKGDHHHHHHDVHEPHNYSPATTRLSLLISRPSTPPEAPPPPPPTVSVPFKWEEAPGKPRQCHTQSEPKNNSATRTLELPPRLLFLEAKVSNNMNMDAPSPTTVLAGPYVGRAMSFTTSYRTPRDNWISNFGSARWSSFRKISEDDAEGSFDFSGCSGHGTSEPKPKVKIARAPRSSLSLSHRSKASSHFWVKWKIIYLLYNYNINLSFSLSSLQESIAVAWTNLWPPPSLYVCSPCTILNFEN